MTNTAKLFFTEVAQNGELAEKYKAIEKAIDDSTTDTAKSEAAKTIFSLAKEYGFDLSPDDLKSLKEDEDFDELDDVAGGIIKMSTWKKLIELGGKIGSFLGL